MTRLALAAGIFGTASALGARDWFAAAAFIAATAVFGALVILNRRAAR